MARSIEADGFKYYVVRNKETGQYFRGKGVNKWGKYYNQASIYRFKKHAENAVEEESRRGNPTEVVEIRIAETADVAPRAEVAREIFEEIERSIYKLETPYQVLHCIPTGYLAELKKKYTEGQKR